MSIDEAAAPDDDDAGDPSRFSDQWRLHLKMVGAVEGVEPFSAAFVWATKFSRARFEAFTGGPRRVTALEAVVGSKLTHEERLALYPTALHPGRLEPLDPSQCTYQAIADDVISTCGQIPGSLGGSIVSQTAVALAKLVGSRVQDFRRLDPSRTARTLWLFVYLKQTRSRGVVGMLEHPGGDVKPSLELSNPYGKGPELDRRMLFADVVTYLTLQMPVAHRQAIDDCLIDLRQEAHRFVNRVHLAARTQEVGTTGGSSSLISHRLRLAARFFSTRLESLRSIATQQLRPLDEQLYVHAMTLELQHLVEFRARIQSGAFPRTALKRVPADPSGASSVPADQLAAQPGSFTRAKAIVEEAIEKVIEPDLFRRAASLAGDVLRHYLPFATGNIFALESSVPFVTVAAAILYALDLLSDPSAHRLEPHVRGQGRICTSVTEALRDEVNGRHEEFEHLCLDAVDWYRAALVGQLDRHLALLRLQLTIEQGVARLCATRDLQAIERAKAMFEGPVRVCEWESEMLRTYRL